MEVMDTNNQTSVERRGGYRQGAGRPIGSKDRGTRLGKVELVRRIARLESLGVLQGTARRVLEALGGDEYWLRVIDRLEAADNHEKIASLMQFLLQMRDGRPPQQITVTNIGIKFSPDEIARARAIARELVPQPPIADAHLVEGSTPLSKSRVGDEAFAKSSPPAAPAAPLMLSEKAGGKLDGV